MLGGGRWKVSKELSGVDINKDKTTIAIVTHKLYFPPTTHWYNDHIKDFIFLLNNHIKIIW